MFVPRSVNRKPPPKKRKPDNIDSSKSIKVTTTNNEQHDDTDKTADGDYKLETSIGDAPQIPNSKSLGSVQCEKTTNKDDLIEVPRTSNIVEDKNQDNIDRNCDNAPHSTSNESQIASDGTSLKTGDEHGKDNGFDTNGSQRTSDGKSLKTGDHHVEDNDCDQNKSKRTSDEKSLKTVELEDEDNGSDEEAPVISFSKNQRWPVGDEPKCVVCGRYGEYICSRTDVDVCSLECKARNLARSINKNASNNFMELTGIPKDSSTLSSLSEAEGLQALNQPPAEENIPLPGYTYQEHEDIEELSREQIQDLRAQVEIFVEGVDIPRPIAEFLHLNLPQTMQTNLDNCGYLNPTPVQMQVIPTALCNRDTMVCAQTSSGKTASFLIPTILNMFNTVCKSNQTVESKEPLAVILTPTRELAMQIEEQAKQLMKGLPNMKTALLVGGMPLPPQLHRLSQGIQLVIATPGRLLEVIQKNGVSLQSVKTLIIDEFDTMLHLGFQQQVLDIVIHLPEPHQTMLFSATIPKSREQIASSLLGNPVYISVGTPSTPCTSVKQIVMWVEEPSKKKKLFAFLQDPKHYRPPIVVFVDSKIGADFLAEAIEKVCDISAVSLHGDKRQVERTRILQGFLSGEHPVIVCTGVLARGIDLPGVTMVVNFDMPSSVEEYIHQIGRTGRLGSKGTAITFVNNGAKHLFLEFVNTLKPLGIQLPLQLVNSQHLHNQKQKYESKKAQEEKQRKKGNSAGYFARKRRENWESVGDLLAKRKKKPKS